jgi:hypothetical protein
MTWKWQCSFYYRDDHPDYRKRGQLAIRTVHKDDVSKDIEVSIGREREDIGAIVVERIR